MNKMSFKKNHTLRSSVTRQSWFGESEITHSRRDFKKTTSCCHCCDFPLVLFLLPSPVPSVCLVAFSWITWSISRLPPPNRPQCVFIYAVFAHRTMASNPRRFSSPLQEQLVQHEAPIWSCPSLMMSSRCNNVQITISFFFSFCLTFPSL